MTNTESKRNKFIPFIKKFSISIIIIFIMTMLEMYWSMGELSTRTSSSCLECGFFEDAIRMSFLTGIFLSLVSMSLFFIKNTFIKAIIQFLLLVVVWLFWNYTIFVDRESSWSTYDFHSEVSYTISLSLFPTILLGCICILLLRYKEIKDRFFTS